MKIGITGHSGTLGRELLEFQNTFPIQGDVKNWEEMDDSISSLHPDVIIHLAAKSGVDFCELPENEQEVRKVNVHGTFNVVNAGYKIGCPVVLLSTDHIFSGRWGKYKEFNRPGPVNFYGLSKLAAESLREAFPNMKIVRTSKLFCNDSSFANDMEGLVRGEHQDYPVFMDRSFMWVRHFAISLMEYARQIDFMPDILHISGCQTVSYYTFMKSVASTFDIPLNLVTPRMKELKEKSPRPHHAGLNVSLSLALGIPQFDYVDGLRAMKSLG